MLGEKKSGRSDKGSEECKDAYGKRVKRLIVIRKLDFLGGYHKQGFKYPTVQQMASFVSRAVLGYSCTAVKLQRMQKGPCEVHLRSSSLKRHHW